MGWAEHARAQARLAEEEKDAAAARRRAAVLMCRAVEAEVGGRCEACGPCRAYKASVGCDDDMPLALWEQQQRRRVREQAESAGFRPSLRRVRRELAASEREDVPRPGGSRWGDELIEQSEAALREAAAARRLAAAQPARPSSEHIDAIIRQQVAARGDLAPDHDDGDRRRQQPAFRPRGPVDDPHDFDLDTDAATETTEATEDLFYETATEDGYEESIAEEPEASCFELEDGYMVRIYCSASGQLRVELGPMIVELSATESVFGEPTRMMY